jgi:hypothetical protein
MIDFYERREKKIITLLNKILWILAFAKQKLFNWGKENYIHFVH